MYEHWTLPDLIKHVIKLYPSRIKTPFTCCVVSTTADMFFYMFSDGIQNSTCSRYIRESCRYRNTTWSILTDVSRHPAQRDISSYLIISDRIWSWWSLQVWGVESNAAFKLNIFPRVTWSTCIFPGWTAEWLIVVLSRWVKFFVHFWRLTPRTLWSWMTKDSTQIYFNLWKMTSVGNLLIFNWMCRFNCPCSFTWVINKTCSWPVTLL